MAGAVILASLVVAALGATVALVQLATAAAIVVAAATLTVADQTMQPTQASLGLRP